MKVEDNSKASLLSGSTINVAQGIASIEDSATLTLSSSSGIVVSGGDFRGADSSKIIATSGSVSVMKIVFDYKLFKSI